MKYEDYLAHFNPNHDKLGRFSKSSTTNIAGDKTSRNSEGRRIENEHYKKKSKSHPIAKSKIRDLTRQIRNGYHHLQELQDMQNNFMQQQINNQFVQQSIIDGNRCMSLAMTGGMNPFMFG